MIADSSYLMGLFYKKKLSIYEFTVMFSEKSAKFVENSLKIRYNQSCHAVA